MSAWGWVRALPFILGEDVWSAFPHIKTWFDRINERPAAQRANALKDRFEFKSEMDAEARGYMFRHVAGRKIAGSTANVFPRHRPPET